MYLGPDQAILLLDCRAERKLDRICSETTYQRCFDRVRAHKGIKHLTILVGVPIACGSAAICSPLVREARHIALCS